MSLLPQDAQERKRCPVYSGVLKYFPDALVAVARCSQDGNDQHHPDKPLHWDKSKSADEMDALMRHAIEGEWESVCWRALANLQREIDNGYVPKSFLRGFKITQNEDPNKIDISAGFVNDGHTPKDLPKPLSWGEYEILEWTDSEIEYMLKNGIDRYGDCAMQDMYKVYLKDFNANNEQPKEDGS